VSRQVVAQGGRHRARDAIAARRKRVAGNIRNDFRQVADLSIGTDDARFLSIG
jgi:hypothetical protein